MFSHKFTTYINKSIFILMIIMVFVMPFYRQLLPPLLILWSILWILEGNFSNKILFLKNNKILWAFFLFYTLLLFGMFYTANTEAGIFQLEVKLGFVIFPLLLCGFSDFIMKHKDKIFYSFILGNLFAALFCIIFAIYKYIQINPFVFNYNSIKQILANPAMRYTGFSVFQHTSYFSAFLCLSIAMIFYFLKQQHKWYSHVVGYFLILFFLFIIFLLSARSGLIAASIVIFCGEIFTILYSKRKFILTIFFLIINIFFINFLINNQRFKSTITRYIGIDQKNENKTIKQSEIRIAIWDASLTAIRKNILLGVGTGDFTEEALKLYTTDELIFAKQYKLNFHNQFLESAFCNGILAAIFLLVIIILGFYQCIINRDFIFLSFLIIIFVNFMFETMLSRQTGVVLFCFWYVFLINMQSPTNKKLIEILKD